MRERYDIIVVGAGPAGSIAAKTAAMRGCRVLMIEKRQEIGDPVRCAEGVAKPRIKKHIEPDDRWIAAEVRGSRIFAPDGTGVELSEDVSGSEVGYVLERKLFDRALADAAALAGAEVQVKTRATGLIMEDGYVKGITAMHLGCDEVEIRADIVIGADGIESKIGRWAGIDTTLPPSKINTCAQFLVADIDIAQDRCEFHLGSAVAPSGYLWIFPKGNRCANIGIGVGGNTCSPGKRPINILQDFVRTRYPDGKIIELVVGGEPASGPIKQTVANGFMLVGDAARQVDPLTGGGIANAMDAGGIAGAVAAGAIAEGDVSEARLQEYDAGWRAEFGKRLDRSLAVKDHFISLTDADLNKLAHSVEGLDFATMDLFGLLVALIKKNPKTLWSLRKLFV
ncbi:MAG: Digeranylgeranylglycerophospholipid reductase [Candidatus Methanogaster sp.]|nr:MAG: Digeranylgeranylglycerophospholipid reductase [ANME-2 cluster archaeon]